MKITTFPTIQDVPVGSESQFSPQGTAGSSSFETISDKKVEGGSFASRFQGDIFTNFGRFGNGTNYWEISETEMKTANWVDGVSGIRITYDGVIDANEGHFRGDITGASGTFTGTINVGSLNIPDTATANSFHTDALGNSWWGCNVADFTADNDNATAYILKTGIAKFQDVILGSSSKYFSYDGSTADAVGVRGIELFTAGETIAVNKVVCFKKKVYNTPVDKTLGITKDAFTDSANPTTNYGSVSDMKMGSYLGDTFKLYFGFNFANVQPDKVILNFYGNVQTIGTLVIYRCTADWNEGTITYNSSPALEDYLKTGVATKVLSSTGNQWITLDITNIVRGQMRAVGDYSMARGVRIAFEPIPGTGYINDIKSLEDADTTKRPYLTITYGLSMQDDGELFIADNTDGNLARRIVGFNLTAGTDGNSFRVQHSGIVSGLSGLTIGQEYYLSTAGTLAEKSFILGDYSTKIGMALSATTLNLNIEEENYLWQSAELKLLTTEISYVFPPLEANECIIKWEVDDGAGLTTGQITVLKRNYPNSIDAIVEFDLDKRLIFSWDDDYNMITITNSTLLTTYLTTYFYK